eukprot:2022092-Amphidinium_carterae.1
MAAVLREFRSAGYAVKHRVLNARPLVPQRRLRLYLVGFNLDHPRGDEAAAAFQWPAWASDADKECNLFACISLQRGEVFAKGDAAEFHECRSYTASDGPLDTEKQHKWPIVREILEPADEVWEKTELSEEKLASVARQDEYWGHSIAYHYVNESGAARTLIGSYLKFGRSDQL